MEKSDESGERLLICHAVIEAKLSIAWITGQDDQPTLYGKGNPTACEKQYPAWCTWACQAGDHCFKLFGHSMRRRASADALLLPVRLKTASCVACESALGRFISSLYVALWFPESGGSRICTLRVDHLYVDEDTGAVCMLLRLGQLHISSLCGLDVPGPPLGTTASLEPGAMLAPEAQVQAVLVLADRFISVFREVADGEGSSAVGRCYMDVF